MEKKDITLITQQIDRGMEILRDLNDMQETSVDKNGLPVIQILKDQKFYNEKEIEVLESKVHNWQLETETCLSIIGFDKDEFQPIFQSQSLGSIDKRKELARMVRLGLSYLGKLRFDDKNGAKGLQMEERGYNTNEASSRFTNTQMGILMHAIGLLTENPAPSKTTLGDVVEKISGYKARTVNQNLKGSYREADKETVATAIEGKFPKLADKVRKL